MSAEAVELPRLEDIGLSGNTPPCEVLPAGKNGEMCGKPSVTRVRLSCCYVRTAFMCAECFEAMKVKPFRCRHCKWPVDWTEI